LEDVLASLKEEGCLWLKRMEKTGVKWEPRLIPYPPNTGGGKAVSVADLNFDQRPDLVLTFEHAGKQHVAGVVALLNPGDLKKPWQSIDISGLEGIKYDLAAILDIDDDGDPDVITTEENDNARNGQGGLGVVWYENPARSAKKE
jgi:hypothetical protein